MFHSPGPTAIHVGPIAIRWYGVLMAVAMALGLWIAQRDARRRGLDPESLLKAAELALLGGLVGARLYYVLFNLEYYSQFPGKIFAVWEGGLAIHGGVVGGVIVGGLYAWRRRLPLHEALRLIGLHRAQLGEAPGELAEVLIADVRRRVGHDRDEPVAHLVLIEPLIAGVGSEPLGLLAERVRDADIFEGAGFHDQR